MININDSSFSSTLPGSDPPSHHPLPALSKDVTNRECSIQDRLQAAPQSDRLNWCTAEGWKDQTDVMKALDLSEIKLII